MNQKPLLSSFLFSLFLFGLTLLLFKSYFMTDDDAFTVLVTKGIGIASQPSEYIFWSNILWGLSLKYLNIVIPSIPWHGIFLFITMFIGFWSLTLALLYSPHSKFKLILLGLCFAIIDLHFLINVHFSAAALLAFEGSFFLAFSLLKNKIKSWPAEALCGCGLLLSFILRTEAFYLGLLLTAPFLILKIFRHKITAVPKRILTTLLLTSTLILACAFTHHFYYQNNKPWNDFLKFNWTFGRLVSCVSLEYDQSSVYAALHWTKNDLQLFRNWYLLDKNKYSAENLETLNQAIPISSWDKKNIGQPFSQIFTLDTAQAIYLLSLILIIFISFNEISTILFTLVWIFSIHSSLFFFMKSPPWIIEPLLVFIPHFFIFLSNPFKAKEPTRLALLKSSVNSNPFKTFILFCVLIYAAWTVSKTYSTNQVNQLSEKNLKDFVQKLNPQPDQLFVAWHSTLPYEAINIFDDNSEYKNFNIFALHEFQRTPVGTEMLDRFQIKDLFPEMVDNQNLLMLCTDEEFRLYSKYMEEKHNEIIAGKAVLEFPGFHVYRILSPKNSSYKSQVKPRVMRRI